MATPTSTITSAPTATHTPTPSVTPTPANTPAPSITPTPTPVAALAPWARYAEALRPAAWQAFDPAVSPAAFKQLSGMTTYSLTVTLAPDLSRLSGTARIGYTNQTTTTLDAIYLHLFPNLWRAGMTVGDVQVAGKPVTPTLQSNASILKVPLATPLSARRGDRSDHHLCQPDLAGRRRRQLRRVLARQRLLGVGPQLSVRGSFRHRLAAGAAGRAGRCDLPRRGVLRRGAHRPGRSGGGRAPAQRWPRRRMATAPPHGGWSAGRCATST